MWFYFEFASNYFVSKFCSLINFVTNFCTFFKHKLITRIILRVVGVETMLERCRHGLDKRAYKETSTRSNRMCSRSVSIVPFLSVLATITQSAHGRNIFYNFKTERHSVCIALILPWLILFNHVNLPIHIILHICTLYKVFFF